jgi:hypothetical protein
MRPKVALFVVAVCGAVFALVACAKEDLLGEMKKAVPIYEGAEVMKSYMPMEKMSVIQMEVDASKASQKEVLRFYEDTLTQKGWELASSKDYGKDGSVLEWVKKDWGTLSIQTITKKTPETGKMPVILSLSTN